MDNLNLDNPKLMDVAVTANQSMGMTKEVQRQLNGIYYDKLINLVKNNQSLLIDLREKIEIEKKSSLNNSINVSYSSLQNYLNKNKIFLKSKTLIFYCAVGERSALAIQICQSYNLNTVYHLIGGINKL